MERQRSLAGVAWRIAEESGEEDGEKEGAGDGAARKSDDRR